MKERSKSKKRSEFVLVSCPGMHKMGASIRRLLKKMGVSFPHCKIEVTQFANSEILPRVAKTIRRQHVFLLQSLQHPDPNTALMGMLLTCDALKRASVAGITIVAPYIPYLRQDRKDQPRVPISARMIADLIESNRAVQGLITVDMHAEQGQGFFSIPVDNLTSTSLFAKYFDKQLKGKHKNVVAVAPDFGGAVRTRRFIEKFDDDIHFAMIEKKRSGPNKSEILSIIGDKKAIRSGTTITFEDMIDTGGTIRKAAEYLKGLGASTVYLSATHGIFSGEATAKFAESGLRVACTDSIPRDEKFKKENPWLDIISIDKMLAEAIYQNSLIGGSISGMNL